VDHPKLHQRRADGTDLGRKKTVGEQRSGGQTQRYRKQEDRAKDSGPAALRLHQQGQPKAHAEQQNRDDHRVFDGEADRWPEQLIP